MNSGSYSVLLGLGLWTIGTVALRLRGQTLLLPGATPRTSLVYLASFVLMALLVRRLKADRESVTLLMLPTLLLDPLSCLFFPSVFPNMDPGAAGLFGGMMLICCAGAVAGVWVKR